MASEKELRSIKSLKEDINKLNGKINEFEKNSVALTEEEKKKLKELKDERIAIGKEIRKQNSERLSNLAAEERGLSSLSELYTGLTQKERQRIEYQTHAQSLLPAQETALNKIASLNRDLAQLNREDFAQRNDILNQIEQQKAGLESSNVELQQILQNLEEQTRLAINYSNITKEQKEQLEGQLSAYKGIKQTIGGVLSTFQTLTSGPAGFFGTLAIGAGIVANKVGQVNKELGTTLSLTNSAGNRAGILSLVFDDAVSNTRALSRELGGLDKASGELQVNMSLVARSFGVSGDEAAVLVGQFSRLQGGSTDTAMNMLATTRALAEANNVAPADVLGEMAGSTEAFALFAKDGGSNLALAAVQAKKLGVELDTLTGITDNLLDFETSITKELELGAMLGKNINLNRARALAYEGEIGGAVQETLTQLGGIEAFNQMDYYAKKETAALLGVSVAQLQKMAAYQEQGKDLSKITAENFDQMDAATQSFLNEGLGNTLKALGGVLLSAGQIGAQFFLNRNLVRSMNTELKATQVMSKSGKLFDINSPQGKMILTKGGTQSVQDGLSQRGLGGAKPQQSIGQTVNKTGGAGINMVKVLQGAAAMLVLAGALFVFAKAAQEFGEVPSWSDVFIGIGAMATLGGVAALLGVGPIAVAAGAGTLIILGLASAFAIFGAGAMMFAGAVNIIANSLQPMADGLTSLIGLVPGIFGLAGALATLGGSLALLGTLGSVALPVLAALGGLGLVAGMIGLGGGEGEEGGVGLSEYQDKMLTKMDQLIGAVAQYKDVYMDGEKVTARVSTIQDRTIRNDFAIGTVTG